MSVLLLKARYLAASLRSKARLFLRRPGTLGFYVSHYGRLALDHAAGRVDATVVSYPKSGRTWLEQLLIALVTARLDIPNRPELTLESVLRRAAGLPLVTFSHAGSSWESTPLTEREIAGHLPRAIAAGKVLYLYRDPRDVLVSAYYHIRFRSGASWLRPHDMLTDPVVGIAKQVAFMNLWTRYVADNPDRAKRLSYESLLAAPVATLDAVCGFLGLPASRDELAAAVEACTFDKLQERERGAAGNNPWLIPAAADSIESYKFRAGTAGAFGTFFSPAELEAVEAVMRERLLVADEYLPPRSRLASH